MLIENKIKKKSEFLIKTVSFFNTLSEIKCIAPINTIINSINPIIMAYNRRNYLKNALFIFSVYREVKQHDIPDTYILRNEFPKHGIFISYRTWMNIKNLYTHKQNELRTNDKKVA